MAAHSAPQPLRGRCETLTPVSQRKVSGEICRWRIGVYVGIAVAVVDIDQPMLVGKGHTQPLNESDHDSSTISNES